MPTSSSLRPRPLLVLISLLSVSLLAHARAPIDLIKINCGGPSLSSIGFLRDDPYFSSASTAIVSSSISTSAPIPAHPWGTVYQTHTYVKAGILIYRLPVPQGVYSVSLMFAEQYPILAFTGARIMNLYINDISIEQNIDVWSRANGLYQPYYLNNKNISSVLGYITISLHPVVENPMLSGIVIEGDNAASILWNTPTTSSSMMIQPSPNVTSSTEASLTDKSVSSVTPIVLSVEQSIESPSPISTTTAMPMDRVGSWRNEIYTSGKPIARHEACAVMADGLIYLIGGRGLKDTSVYNPNTGSWWTRTGLPVELNHMQCVFWQGRIWIGSSWYGKFPREKEHEEMWVYDIVDDFWFTRAGLSEGRRRGGGAFVQWDEKLYLSHGAVGGHGIHANTTAWFDVYDPETDVWTALADAPNGRDHTAGAVVAGMLCVGGGRDGGTSDFWNNNIGAVDCFNFDTESWETKASLPVPRAGSMVGRTCDDRLMIAGGEGKSEMNRFGRAYDRVDILDVRRNTYAPPSYMTSARHGTGLVIASCECGKVFVPSGSAGLGGGPEVMTTDVWFTGEWRSRCS